MIANGAVLKKSFGEVQSWLYSTLRMNLLSLHAI